VSRTGSLRSTSQSDRNGSPARPPRRPRQKENDAPGRVLDPAEAFVLEDDLEEPSGTSTPAILDEKASMAESTPTLVGPAEGSEKGEDKPAATAQPSSELPPEVRTKLRKLELLESKYKGLCSTLRSSMG
jgi:hypothetical protein